jgi:hypothetical protein
VRQSHIRSIHQFTIYWLDNDQEREYVLTMNKVSNDDITCPGVYGILFGKIIIDKFIARDSVVLVWPIITKPIKQRRWESHCQSP